MLKLGRSSFISYEKTLNRGSVLQLNHIINVVWIMETSAAAVGAMLLAVFAHS
jgi:hypothetical protein